MSIVKNIMLLLFEGVIGLYLRVLFDFFWLQEFTLFYFFKK